MLSASEDQPDEIQYPLIYRPSWGWLALMAGCGLLSVCGCIAIAAIGIWQLAVIGSMPSLAKILLSLGGFLFFGFLGANCIIESLEWRVVVSIDEIKVIEFMRNRKMYKRNITGLRIKKSQHVRYLVLSSEKKKIKIPLMFAPDLKFQAWFENIPDLDAIEREQALREVMSDPTYGSNETVRARNLTKAQKLSKIANFSVFGLAGWAWLYPRPYMFCMITMILTPPAILYLVAVFPKYFALEDKRNQIFPSILPAFMLPGFVIAIRSFGDVHLIDVYESVIYSVMLTFTIVIFSCICERRIRSKIPTLIILGLLLLTYGYGTVAESDSLLDTSDPQIFKATVAGKHFTSGKGAHAEITLLPWGPLTDSSAVPVPTPLYREVTPGSLVCVALHPGALHIRWYQVHLCD